MLLKKSIIIALSFFIIIGGIVFITLDSDNDKLTGYSTVTSSVTVLPYIPAVCSFPMYSGWNLVSFRCISMYASIPTVMESVNTNYESIFYYDSTDAIDPWKSYNPSLPTGVVQQLTALDRTSGYWVHIFNDTNYIINGSRKTSVINLHQGWNLIGYPSNISRNITSVSSIISFNTLETYDTSAAIWLVYVSNQSGNTLDTLEQNKGYWINASYDQNWDIN